MSQCQAFHQHARIGGSTIYFCVLDAEHEGPHMTDREASWPSTRDPRRRWYQPRPARRPAAKVKR